MLYINEHARVRMLHSIHVMETYHYMDHLIRVTSDIRSLSSFTHVAKQYGLRYHEPPALQLKYCFYPSLLYISPVGEVCTKR